MVVVLAAMTGVVVTAAPSEASIQNPPGFVHWKVQESGKCMTLNGDTGYMMVWRCLNAPSEEWSWTTVSVAGGFYAMLSNHWTGQCLAVPNWPVNGTPLVQAPCDVNDVRQYWRLDIISRAPVEISECGRVALPIPDINWPPSPFCRHFMSLQGALCIDKPKGSNSDGVYLRMWTCAGSSSRWPEDGHSEQVWTVA
jgi:hypothetical protein